MRGCLICLFLFTVVAHAQAPAVSDDSLLRLNDAFTRLAGSLAPAVVAVRSNAYEAASEESEAGAPVALQQNMGSGVIVAAEGYIVTNAHVVAGSTRVRVRLSPSGAAPGKSVVRPPGRVLPARIVGLDLETDLALIKVDASDLPHLELADSEQVRQGQIVLALGNPFGLEDSVSMGVISAVARQLRPDSRMIYLQTDAPVNPGNSGGPLVDVNGRVVGINTMLLSQSGGSEGVGFAVPSNIVRTVMEQLRRSGVMKRGDIGLEAQTITPAIAAGLGLSRNDGVVVADVSERGPADNADIRVGDVVLSLNGKPMENARQFHVNLYQRPVASTVTLEILRGGEKLTKTAVVLERLDTPERLATLVNDRQHLVSRLGVLGVALAKKLIDLLPSPPRRSYGILVARTAVTARGAAGLFQPGDILYKFNNQPLSTMLDLRGFVEKTPPGETAILQVERDGKTRFVEVILD
jgi:serine protease Do